jgi:SH3-like domain-containing protein
LEILEEYRGSVRVLTSDGLEGWTGRYALVTAEIRLRMDWQRDQSANLISQGTVQALDVLNVHLDPARDSETIYQLKPDEPAELLARRLVIDDIRTEGWFLVRLATGHSGWLLETRVYSGIPVEVAQYAEGRRINAYFSLGEIEDTRSGDLKTTWLWAQSPGRNSEVDFDRIRVFRWSDRRGVYQTIKLERGLRGFLPITVRDSAETGRAQFDVMVETPDGFVLRTYEVRGARVVRVGQVPFERDPVVLTPPPVVAEETEPPGMLERLRSWWRSVS